MSKWIELPIKDIPSRQVSTVTVYNFGQPHGVFLIKRRDTKRNKLWVVAL